MSLIIIYNDSNGHLGTPDRDSMNGTEEMTFFDFPGKHSGCLAAAKNFAALTNPAAHPANSKRLRGRDGSLLSAIEIRQSTRIPTNLEIQSVHSSAYLDGLRRASEIARHSQERGDGPFNFDFGEEAAVSPGTFLAARAAVGACFDAVDVVLQSPDTTAFANVWPPGHHAEPNRAMGFCYLSNVALAAKYARDHAIKVRPGQTNRVLIIDLDNHEGNGTARAVAGEEGIRFFDIIQRSPHDSVSGHYADGTYDGETGGLLNRATEFPPRNADKKLGISGHSPVLAANITRIEFFKLIPGWSGTPIPAVSPQEILKRFILEVLDAVEHEEPYDIILYSFGADSAGNDKLGGLGQTPASLHTIVLGMRHRFPAAKHIAIMEGGYHPPNWTRCLTPVLCALHEELSNVKIRSRLLARYVGAFDPGWTWRGFILAGPRSLPELTQCLLRGPYRPLTSTATLSLLEMIKGADTLMPSELAELAAACHRVSESKAEIPWRERVRYVEIAMQANQKAIGRWKCVRKKVTRPGVVPLAKRMARAAI